MRRKIESLHGLIEVERMEDPPRSLVIVIKESEQIVDGVPELRARIKQFVDLDALSPALQAAVRGELGRTTRLPRMASDTQEEYDAEHAELVADALRTPLPPCPTCGELMRVKGETNRRRPLVECTKCGHLFEAVHSTSWCRPEGT